MGVLWGRGKEIRNPEKDSDCITDLIGGGDRGGCTCYIFHKGVYRGGHGAKSPKHTN